MISVRCDQHKFDDIRAVLFDKDGTLADSGNFLARLGRRRARLIDARIPGVQEPLLMAMGISDDGTDPAGLMAVSSRWETEVAAAAYVAETGRGWREALTIVSASFAEADADWGGKAAHTPPFGDVSACLQHLRKSGLKLGIASADTSDNVREFVEHYGLSSYFDLVLGSDLPLGSEGQLPTFDGDRQAVKPEAAFLEKACDLLKVAPSQLLVVGDSLADVELARQADTAGCILIDRGGADSEAIAAAAVTLPTLTALQAHLS